MNEDTYWLGWLTRFWEASEFRCSIDSDIDWDFLYKLYLKGFTPQDAFDTFFRED